MQTNAPECADATLAKTVSLAAVQPGGAEELKYRFMLATIPGATSSGPDATSGAPPTRFGLGWLDAQGHELHRGHCGVQR